MPVPLLAQGSWLIASVQSALSDADLVDLEDRLLRRVDGRRVSGVVIDVTALDVLDSFATRMLRRLAAMLRLRGAETVVVGIQPEVAMAMVQLGLSMADVPTGLDLDEGLAYLQRGK